MELLRSFIDWISEVQTPLHHLVCVLLLPLLYLIEEWVLLQLAKARCATGLQHLQALEDHVRRIRPDDSLDFLQLALLPAICQCLQISTLDDVVRLGGQEHRRAVLHAELEGENTKRPNVYRHRRHQGATRLNPLSPRPRSRGIRWLTTSRRLVLQKLCCQLRRGKC